MSGLGLAALVAVAAWLAALSLVTMLLIRQLGLVTMRLSLVAPHAPADAAGPELGSAVPPGVRAILGRDGRPTVLLLLSATCATCRSLAARLGPRELAADAVVLVAGRQPLASGIAELLPPDTDVRFDPHASQIAGLLALDTVPFGLRIDSGVVSMKAFLHGPDDALRLSGGDVAEPTLSAANPRRLFQPDEGGLKEHAAEVSS